MPICDICEKEIQEADIGQGLELVGGKELKFLQDDKEYYTIRCDKCYEKDTSLKNFKKCEVFTRCVGYMRPVGQFHKGKQQEYSDRTVFKEPILLKEKQMETPETPVEAPVEATPEVVEEVVAEPTPEATV